MATLVFGLCCPLVQAETGAGETTSAAADPGTASASAMAGTEAKPRSRKHQTRLEVLVQKLSLTPEQTERVTLILKDQRAAEKQLRKDVSVPDDLKRERRRKIVSEHEEQIRGVLTEGQKGKFEQLLTREHARDRM